MSSKESDYDFLCTNDTRQIKLAIQGEAFFAAAIQSETAKKIDLSGGTKNIAGITLAYCLKLTRIIWPADTGAIKRLAMHSADALTSLDVSTLTNLEELSIFNCAKLESVTGLGKSVKVVNIHGANLKSLDLSKAKTLQKLNILTLYPDFAVSVKNCNALQFIYLQGNQIKCNIQHCPALTSLLITSGSLPVEVSISASPNVIDACVIANENSVITGLEDCKKVTRHHADSQKATEFKKLASDFVASILQYKPGPEDMETVIQKYGTIRERNHACIIMISLLSSMEKTLTLELEKEDFHTKLATQETRALNDYPEPIIFLPEVNIKIPEAALQSAIRFPNKAAEIIAWLKRADEDEDNILLLNKSDIKNIAILNLVKQIEHKHLLLTFMGIQYKLPPMSRIIADFPRSLLRHAAPMLFTSSPPLMHAIPPADSVTPVIAATPIMSVTHVLDADKKISDATLQRMMSETLRLLDHRQAMQKTMLRRFSNALNRLIASRNRFLMINTKLKQAQQDHITAATKTTSKIDGLPVKRKGKPIEAPPALLVESENPALKDIKVDISSEEQDLHHQRNGSPIGAPTGLLIASEEQPALLNLEQVKKINLELDITPTPAEKEKTEAKEIAADPAVIDTSEQLSALENLMFDTNHFAATLTMMTQEAKSRVKPNDMIIQPATLIIEKSVATALTNLSFAKSTRDTTAKFDSLLKAAQELSDALKKLNEACTSSFKQTNDQLERARLINLLSGISKKFLEAHQLNDQSSGVFGTGLRAGINAIRMHMLNNWLEVLKNNRPLPSSGFNATLTELFKDKELKSALQPEIEFLRKYLTSSPEPAKRKQ